MIRACWVTQAELTEGEFGASGQKTRTSHKPLELRGLQIEDISDLSRIFASAFPTPLKQMSSEYCYHDSMRAQLNNDGRLIIHRACPAW